MNSQNPEEQNSSWRQQGFMQESRNQGLSRAENYYTSFPSSQMVNDYLPGGYVYPGMMPPFRHGEFNLPPINEDWNPSFGMMKPETYNKLYSQVEQFGIQGSQFGPKNFANPNNIYDSLQNFRPQSSYDRTESQRLQTHQSAQLPVGGPSVYPSQECLRTQKSSRNKNVIIIESDEDQVADQSAFEPVKSAPQKSEQIMVKQLSKGIQVESKKSSIGVEVPPQFKQGHSISNFPQTIVDRMADARQKHLQNLQKPPHFDPHFNGKVNGNSSVNFPSFKIPIGEFVPCGMIVKLHQDILRDFETLEFPDITMKLFLKYRAMEAMEIYEKTKGNSFEVFNSLKYYKTIIHFQMERKDFIQNMFSQQIFGLNTGYKPFNANTAFNTEKRFEQFNNRSTFKSKFSNEYPKEKNQSLNSVQQILSKDYQRPIQLNKTKKITKKDFSDHNSDEANFNARTKYLQKYDLQPSQRICDRKLRDRKKKKNKRDRNDKNSQQRLRKDKYNERQNKTENSKNDKQVSQKEITKKTVELSHEDEGLIDKIKGWAEKTVLADAIEEKHKKSLQKPKNQFSDASQKSDPFRVIKKQNQLKKASKQRSSKQSQQVFRQTLGQKIAEAKASKQISTLNLITFQASNNLTEFEKEEYQKQLTQLIKDTRNNDSHGKIRIGKEYYQAKMPNFVRTESELKDLIREKRQKLMERKMTVLTF